MRDPNLSPCPNTPNVLPEVLTQNRHPCPRDITYTARSVDHAAELENAANHLHRAETPTRLRPTTSAITTALPVQRKPDSTQKRFLPEQTRGTHADTSPDKTNLNALSYHSPRPTSSPSALSETGNLPCRRVVGPGPVPDLPGLHRRVLPGW